MSNLEQAAQPLAAERKRNFCERCGKRLGGADHIHTCTPPQPAPQAAIEQEPVAWINCNVLTGKLILGWECESELASEPLYTSPPAHSWVGLTDKEVRTAYCTISDKEWAIGGMEDATKFTRAIEAKLKEKNT